MEFVEQLLYNSVGFAPLPDTGSMDESDHDLGSENVTAGVRYLAKKGFVANENVEALAVMLQSALNGAGFALARNSPGVTQQSVYEAFEVLVKSLR